MSFELFFSKKIRVAEEFFIQSKKSRGQFLSDLNFPLRLFELEAFDYSGIDCLLREGDQDKSF